MQVKMYIIREERRAMRKSTNCTLTELYFDRSIESVILLRPTASLDSCLIK